MTTPERNESEIGALLESFEAEYQSAYRALRSFAYGTTQHKFITARMERMRVLQEMIAEKVGEDEAAKLVVEQMDKPAKPKGENDAT